MGSDSCPFFSSYDSTKSAAGDQTVGDMQKTPNPESDEQVFSSLSSADDRFDSLLNQLWAIRQIVPARIEELEAEVSLLKQENTELNSDRLRALGNIEAPDEDHDSAFSEAERSDGDTQAASENDAPENDRVSQDMNETFSSHNEEDEEDQDPISVDDENNDEDICSERSLQHEGFEFRTSAMATMAELENDMARVDVSAAKVSAVRPYLLGKTQTFKEEIFASGEHP